MDSASLDHPDRIGALSLSEERFTLGIALLPSDLGKALSRGCRKPLERLNRGKKLVHGESRLSQPTRRLRTDIIPTHAMKPASQITYPMSSGGSGLAWPPA